MKNQISKFLKCFFCIMVLLYISLPVASFSEDTAEEDQLREEAVFEQQDNESPDEESDVTDEEAKVDEPVVKASDKAKSVKTSDKAKVSDKSSAQTQSASSVEPPQPGDPKEEDSIFPANPNTAGLDVSQNLGFAGMKFPIAVPRGRNGLTPDIALNYRSSANNGMAGVGWDLNSDSIRRSTKRGTCYTCKDFTYNGEDLVAVNVDANGIGTYRPEKEQSFPVIRYNLGNYWTVTLKNGLTYTYGANESSRQANSYGTFQWLLTTIEDTNRNKIFYTYTQDQGQVYLESVGYSDYYTLFFFFESRPDPIEVYNPQTKVVTGKRLKTITVRGGSEGIRAYGLTYGVSSNTNRSLLKEITLYGSDYQLDGNNTLSGGTSLPPMNINYQQPSVNFTSIQSGMIFPYSGDNNENPVLLGDWNGDGKEDIGRDDDQSFSFFISTGDGFTSWTGFDDLTVENIDPLKDHPDYKSYEGNISRYPILTQDWNGDGKTDIARVGRYKTIFYISTGNGFVHYCDLNDFSLNDGYASDFKHPILSGDFNGDGKADIARINGEGRFFYYLSTGSGFSSQQEIPGFNEQSDWIPTEDNRYFHKDESPVLTGDFNGDGRTDIICISKDKTVFYLSTGQEFIKKTSTIVKRPTNQDGGFISYPAVTGDFNGDGLTDIGQVENRRFVIYFSTGTGFVESQMTISEFGCIVINDRGDEEPSSYSTTPIFSGDFNGDGLSDVGKINKDGVAIYISKGNAFVSFGTVAPALKKDLPYSTYPLVKGDFTGTGKTSFGRVSQSLTLYSPEKQACDLAYWFTSFFGSETRITYEPFSDPGNKALPFALQAVSNITTSDGLKNEATTSYVYSGGMYDYSDRELRNFRTIVKTNPDGTKETTLYHQGKFLDGKQEKTEFRDPAGNLLTRVIYTWVSSPYNSASSFIFLESKAETRYENGKTLVSQENYTWDTGHGSLLTKTLLASTGSGLTEDIITAYEYGYYGTGLTYPLRTTAETLSGSTSGVARQTQYSYQTNTGNLLSEAAVNITGPDPITTYGHDNYGNISSITDPMGNVTYYDYDTQTHSYLIKITKPVTGIYPHITEYPSIDFRYGKPLIFKNENSNLTTYEYDVFGRVTRILYPDTGEEGYVYIDTFTDSLPRSITKRIRDGAASFINTITYLDGFGRTIQTVEPSISNSFAVSLFTFDNMGRPACTRGPLINTNNAFLFSDFASIASNPANVSAGISTTWTRNYYDALSRVTCAQRSGDETTWFSYELLKTVITDPDGNNKTKKSNLLGKIIEIVEHGPTDHSTLYSYNPAGDLLKVSRMNPSTGNPIENILTYNTLGQKLTMADPDMGNWEYTYDLNGNLKTQKDDRNTLITFDYDALNRKIKKTYPDNGFAEYQYDGAVNGIGLLWRKSNANGSTTYSFYDKMGRLLTETRIINYLITLNHTYDLLGRLSFKSVRKNRVLFKALNYAFYPGTNLLERVSDGSNNTLAVITRYSSQGKMESISFGGGKTVTNYDYVPLTGRLNTINAYTVSGGLPLICKGYDYNKSGDITALHDIKNNIDYTYVYDHLHRLISEESSGGGASAATTVEVIDFTYTQASGKPVHAPTATQLNGASTQYDYTATGTRLNKADGFNTTAYEVNYDNQIKKITEGGIVTNFFYDADGKRIKKTQGAYTTLYFGKDFEIINNVSTLYAFAGNLRIAKMTAAATEYYHKDHQGSTNAITTDTGTIIDTAEYLPYGPDRSANALLNRSAYKYTDQEQDAGTGLYNYDARLYDPVLGQFVMADTIVPDPSDPQTLNRYAYCLNNPLKYEDPTGHLAILGGIGLRGTFLGFAFDIGISAVLGSENGSITGKVSAYAEGFFGGGLSIGRGGWFGGWTGDVSDLNGAYEIGIDTPLGCPSFAFNPEAAEFGVFYGGPALGASAWTKTPFDLKWSEPVFEFKFDFSSSQAPDKSETYDSWQGGTNYSSESISASDYCGYEPGIY